MRPTNLEKFPDIKKKLEDIKKNLVNTWGFDPAELKTSDEYARGFTQIPNVIYRYLPRLTDNNSKLEKVLFYIISRDFDGKGNSFPGIRMIAEEIDSSPGTVGRHLKKLQKLELIKISRRQTKRGQTTNFYSWNGLKKRLRELMIQDGLIKDEDEM